MNGWGKTRSTRLDRTTVTVRMICPPVLLLSPCCGRGVAELWRKRATKRTRWKEANAATSRETPISASAVPNAWYEFAVLFTLPFGCYFCLNRLARFCESNVLAHAFVCGVACACSRFERRCFLLNVILKCIRRICVWFEERTRRTREKRNVRWSHEKCVCFGSQRVCWICSRSSRRSVHNVKHYQHEYTGWKSKRTSEIHTIQNLVNECMLHFAHRALHLMCIWVCIKWNLFRRKSKRINLQLTPRASL